MAHMLDATQLKGWGGVGPDLVQIGQKLDACSVLLTRNLGGNRSRSEFNSWEASEITMV